MKALDNKIENQELEIEYTDSEIRDLWTINKISDLKGNKIKLIKSTEPNSLVVNLASTLNFNFATAEQYKEEVFLECIGNTSNAYEILLNKLSEFKVFLDSKMNLVDEIYDKKVEDLNNDIDKIRDEINRYKSTEEIEIDKLKFDLEDKIKLIEEETVAINNLIIQYGEEIDKATSKIIDASNESIMSLIKNDAEQFNLRDNLLRKMYDDDESVKIRLLNLKFLSDRYQKRVQAINSLIENLNLSGINPVVYNLLIGVGIICSIAAGYFFSIYALDINLNNESTPFFILKGIFQFGDTLGLNTAWYKPLIAIIFWILLLFLITIIFQFSDSGDFGNINKKNMKFAFDSERSKMAFSTESLYYGWKQILPFIFLFGLVFIIFFIARAGIANIGELDRLDISLSAQIIGTTLAFGVYGLIYLYINKIAEPRILSYGQIKNFSKANIELSIFTGSIMLILIFAAFFGDIISSEKIVIFMFILTSLIGGISFGYGYRYRGLLRSENYLLKQLDRINRMIEITSRRFDLKAHVEEENIFQEQINSIRNELYQLVKNKSVKGQSLQPLDTITDDKNPKEISKDTFLRYYLFKLKQKFFAEKNSELEKVLPPESVKIVEDSDFNFSLITMDFFEQNQSNLNNQLLAKIHVKFQVRETLGKDIRGLKLMIFKLSNRVKINELEEFINEIERYILMIKAIKYNIKNQLANEALKIRTAIIDGFELNKWYHKSLKDE